MGYHNVAAVMAQWAQLDHRPMLLLIHMSLVSLDPPGREGVPPCHYWGSVELQTIAMNYHGKNAGRTLRRLRQGLVTAGALELVRPGHKGRPPVWRVVTDPPREASGFPWLA